VGLNPPYQPTHSDALAAWYLANPEATLIAGATDVGLWVTKQFRDLGPVAFLGHCTDLQTITRDGDTLRVGAGVTMTRLHTEMTALHPSYAELIRRYGSVQVRNAATIGGSLANGSPIGDNAPALIALGATLHLRRGDARRAVALEDFFIAYGQQDRSRANSSKRSACPPMPPPCAATSCPSASIRISRRSAAASTLGAGGFAMSMGKPLPHDAAPLHVTGQARYIDDLSLPSNALHLAFGLSTVAHGEITGLDLSAVRAAPGVVAVLSAEDLPEMPDCSPSAHDEPLLAVGTVHYVGQPVFLVIADSHLAARKAARLGKVTYRELPALLTVDDALAAGSRFEQGPVIWQKGDATGAIAKAAKLVEGSFEVGGQEHFYLEGQVAAAIPQEGGDMIVHSSTQHPTEVQHKVAHALHVPMSAVRVEVRRMGGGFGGKESQGNALAIACAIAAHRLGRPARMRYDRDDDMVITGKRHDLRIHYRAGWTIRGASWGWSSPTSSAAAGARTFRCQSPTVRCCMPTTATTCPISVSNRTA
jgi:hypothetical protein